MPRQVMLKDSTHRELKFKAHQRKVPMSRLIEIMLRDISEFREWKIRDLLPYMPEYDEFTEILYNMSVELGRDKAEILLLRLAGRADAIYKGLKDDAEGAEEKADPK